jgi:hypothetical protein
MRTIQSTKAVFRIRIRMDPNSISRLDPTPDSGGLKRDKMKRKKKRYKKTGI